MTVQDFIKYYKTGHGRAVYALQSVTDKEPYRKAFFECVKEQDDFHPTEEYIIALAKMLLTKETTREFIDIIFEKASLQQFLNYSLIKVLIEFSPREEVITFIETEYDKSFKDQLKCALETAPRYLNSKYISRFTAIAKLLGDNDDRLKALIKDGAALYEVNKDLRPTPILRMKRIRHNDKERFSRLFDEALSDNPLYGKIRAIIDEDYSEPKRREYKTVEDYIKGTDDDYHNALECFSEEDAEIVKKVAEIAIDQNSEHRVAALTLFLDESKYHEGFEYKHRSFPLDSKYLIDIIEKYKHLYSPEPETPLDGCWAFIALSILKDIKGNTAKEYCISIMKDESLCEMMRCNAIETFDVNYDPSDAELLKEHYKYCNYSVLFLLERFAKHGVKDAPYEICFDTYENAKNSWDRNLAVTVMAKLDMLTPEMINECRYDECRSIRDLASELLKKEIK